MTATGKFYSDTRAPISRAPAVNIERECYGNPSFYRQLVSVMLLVMSTAAVTVN